MTWSWGKRWPSPLVASGTRACLGSAAPTWVHPKIGENCGSSGSGLCEGKRGAVRQGDEAPPRQGPLVYVGQMGAPAWVSEEQPQGPGRVGRARLRGAWGQPWVTHIQTPHPREDHETVTRPGVLTGRYSELLDGRV